MKYVFILGLLTFVGALIYWRLRPYIRMARRVFGAFSDVRRMRVAPEERADLPRQSRGHRQGGAPTEKLVRCATCGTWLPASRAVSLQQGASQSLYCSHACLERAAEDASPPRQTRQSAS